ncbi:hypothetical protein M2158_004707 [Streptomyces sp. SAI-144]|nr:hypothetical protein [Streptomyces sp. SAI-144]
MEMIAERGLEKLTMAALGREASKDELLLSGCGTMPR